MIGPDGDVIYVGKSVRVRSRVLSYFTADEEEKAGAILREARTVEWEYVPNEFGALLREMRLIQRHRPRWNVQHKRRPAYCFVKITRDLAPRLAVATRVAQGDAIYFGPFPRVRRVVELVRELAAVVGIRDCPATTPVYFADQLEMFGSGRVPRCLRGDVGTCLAPCAGRPDESTYGARVREARRWLEGRGDAPGERLAASMAEAVTRHDFEYAAVLRDRAARLREFRGQLSAWRGELDGLDLLYRVPGWKGEDRLYLIRKGRVCAELDYPKSAASRATAEAAIESVFGCKEPDPHALERDEAAEILFVASWFRARPRELERTKSPRDWLNSPRGR